MLIQKKPGIPDIEGAQILFGLSVLTTVYQLQKKTIGRNADFHG